MYHFVVIVVIVNGWPSFKPQVKHLQQNQIYEQTVQQQISGKIKKKNGKKFSR